VWTYRIAAGESGTEVTESFELLRDIPWYIRLWRRSFMGVTDRKADLEANMRRTPLNLKVAAENQQPEQPVPTSPTDKWATGWLPAQRRLAEGRLQRL
jgi:hypothetical protein